ncbi:MAG: excinuclease ABC subunit UvrB [Vampirovibrionales bacterium]|nr:excinuclease ABC subunit UvrB [Vampirovibrionales bacterium]
MRDAPFQLVSEFPPAGDQPQAIARLIEGIELGHEAQTLLGVTGSGKTFTMASVIAQLNRPALIMSHNKTLAAQLYNEMKQFFPRNAVEYFISYYDYYQPEAYIPRTDTYIEKSASINDEIDRLRHSATRSLFERRDTIVVASVSCIYGLGLPENYFNAALRLAVGQTIEREEILKTLVRNQYERNDLEIGRARFRVRGDVIEVQPVYEERLIRVELFGDEVERLRVVDVVSGQTLEEPSEVVIYPAMHYVANSEDVQDACAAIERELDDRLRALHELGKLVEAQRLMQRTRRDLESIRQLGYCPGIENYSRIFERRPPGSPPRTLVDYFPDDFLLFIDESHVTLPQLRGMAHGDRSRKDTLIDYGFRLPCARDNRPLTFDEFGERIGQRVFVSATPSPYELGASTQVAEQIIRPTGLVDPQVRILPTAHQVDALHEEILARAARDERALITTLTKRMAEDLCEYFEALNVRVRYLHSDIKPIERIEILRDLRLGNFDALIGVNLLREGLDLPEVSLVAIMDADKEGFLRSESSLIQTIGRAARNVGGEVLLFADRITDSMQRALDETQRRRDRQIAHNETHGITPTTIQKDITNDLLTLMGAGAAEREEARSAERLKQEAQAVARDRLPDLIEQLTHQMREAARMLEFERAAAFRDQLMALKAVAAQAPS